MRGIPRLRQQPFNPLLSRRKSSMIRLQDMAQTVCEITHFHTGLF